MIDKKRGFLRRKLDIRCTICILLSWMCLFSGTGLFAREQDTRNETGIPQIKNFSPGDYNANPMNWGMVRDKRGILYTANLNGILEFDGTSWRLIKTPKGAWVLSIDADSSGTIYAGLFADFGYLAPDSLGQMQFRSLLEYVAPDDRNFAEVWRTHCTRAGTYFRSADKIFLWSNNTMKVIRSEGSFTLSSVLDETLYVEDRGYGLKRTNSAALIQIPDSERIKSLRFVAILPYNERYKLICTGNGLLLFNGHLFSPFDSPVNAFIHENIISSAVALPGGHFAIGTYRAGACIINHHGTIVQVLNKLAGLQNEDVKNLYSDAHGNLWMALNSGITRVAINSPFSFFTERRGLKGNVVSVVRHNNTIYAATSQSVFYLESVNTGSKLSTADSEIQLPVFKPVKGISTQGFWLLSTESGLLAATAANGVYRVDGDRAYQTDSERKSSFCLHRSARDPNIVYAGMKNGVQIIRLKGQKWTGNGKVKGIHEEIRTIVEDEQGSIWLGTVFQGVLRVELISQDTDGWNAHIEHFGRSAGLPDGPVNISRVSGNIVFATHKGHRRFDQTTRYFYPDSSLSAELADTSLSAAWVDQDRFGRFFVWPAIAERKSELWIGKPDLGGNFGIDKLQFRLLTDFGLFHKTYTDRDNIIWIGCSSGLVRYDPRIRQYYSLDYPARIRRIVTIPGDSLIFAGFASTENRSVILPYDSNSLRFEYAVPSLENISGTSYQYLLNGFDEKWSNWTDETRKDYTNLSHGNYRFRVRAKNIYNGISDEAHFQFTIGAPWYLRWWAYWGYVLIVFVGIYTGSRVMRSQLVKREIKKAELREAEIISQKNKELQKKNTQLEEILHRLQIAQNALIESESRFRSVAESANDAVITADKTGKITFWNKRAETIFGYTGKTIIGQPLTVLMPERYQQEHLKGIEHFFRTGQGRIMGQVVELEAVHKNGKEFPIELTLADWETHDEKFVTGIVRDISKRKKEEQALRNTQTQLYQSEKMSTLGKLSAGMAHELNNPAGSAKRSSLQLREIFINLQRVLLKIGNLDLSEKQKETLVLLAQSAKECAENPLKLEASLRSDREQEIEKWLETQDISNTWELAPPLVNLGYDPPKLEVLLKKFPIPQVSAVINWQCATFMIYSLLSEIALGTGRIVDIVDALKAYTYMDQKPLQKVDIHKDLENTLIILKSKLKDGIIVKRKYDKNLPFIEAYGGELNQVWTNIIDNAIDAMGGRGELILRTRKNESWVKIEITDNGPGISKDIQSKIFDSFFTTKKMGVGTGLGLNLSHTIIVQKHHGQITFSSKPGQTTFTVHLPIQFKADV